jgi:hypothetical protein
MTKAFRRQGSGYALVNQHDGGGSALDGNATTLVVGDRLAKGQREAEGVVRIFPIGSDGLHHIAVKPTGRRCRVRIPRLEFRAVRTFLVFR